MAKPVVDGLEADLAGQADVLRLSILSDVGGALARRYGVRGVPTLMVFDGAGEVIYSAAGMPDREAIVAAAESAAAR
jgi:thioredoxin-related protein